MLKFVFDIVCWDKIPGFDEHFIWKRVCPQTLPIMLIMQKNELIIGGIQTGITGVKGEHADLYRTANEVIFNREHKIE